MAVLLLLLALAQDPVQLRAALGAEEIVAGETTTLRVDVETDGPRAEIQPFRSLPPGLELQGSRDYDRRQFSIPGGTRRFISREFVLRARAAGRYRIPAVNVIVDGRTYSTRSLLLTVTGAPARAAGRASSRAGEGVVLRAWLDADTVYVGEQVTMQAEAMFSQEARLRLRRAPEYEPPSPSGFWVHDLPDRRRPVSRAVDGEVYEVQRFRRAFFPLAPGRYTIGPARLEYEIRRGLLYSPETRELISDSLSLVVLPVPTPRPEGYTGAVGSYSIRGWLEPSEVPAGEAATLSVEVSGAGNVKTLPPPELPALEGVEVFPPSETAETRIENGRVGGTKRFSWVLIPRRAGELEIPEIRYAYFDPAADAFGAATAAGSALQVSPGGAAEPEPDVGLRYLHPEPGAADPFAWVRSARFAVLQLVPLLAFGAALAWRRRGDRSRMPSRRALRRRRKDRLSELQARVGEPGAGLFTDADRFARDWLAERVGAPAAEAARPSTLMAAGVSEETARSVRGVLDRLAAARYAPTPPGPEARRDLLSALGRWLDRVDQEAARRGGVGATDRAGATAGRALLLALVLPLLSGATATPVGARIAGGEPHGDAPAERPAPASRVASPAAAFAAGVTAFDEERYLDAAVHFDRYLAARPDDPAAWYNLGTAYYRAGRRGAAVHAWLRVPRLNPRDDDVRHNLRVAGVPPELVARFTPPLPLRTSELLFLASLAWLVGGATATLWALRRSRAAGSSASIALLLALALAGSAWASTRDPETLILLDRSTLRAAPALRADPVAELEAGSGVVPVDSVSGWLRARTLSGAEGWLETETLAR